MLKRVVFLCLFAVLFSGIAFSQSYDIPPNLSARINSMAGSGSAITSGGMAIAMNPAGMANTRSFEAEGTFTSIALMMTNPANGPYLEKNVIGYSAIGGFGMGYRLGEVVTVGFLLYAPSGGGVRNSNVTMGYPVWPKDFDGYLVFLEFGPCIALNLPGGFKIGFVYRINYTESWSTLYNYSSTPVMGSNYLYVKNHLSGYGFDGFRVGIQWDPTDEFHIGVAYRSFVKINADGKSRIQPFDIGVGISQTQRYADGFHAGLSYEFIPDRLTVNVDYVLNFWSRYKNRTLETMGIPNVTRLRNKDVHGIRVGIEWWVTDTIAVRAGYNISSGQARAKYQNLLSSGAPGRCQVMAAGAGFRLNERWILDLSLSYMINEGRVTGFDYVRGGGIAMPGNYKNNGFFAGIGARYNL
ncbi:MAG: outer membrane protein transport protein [Spirochaetes bacterium]|nr:outer membrane protein transport protein [Spirochaetota bacterium]